jgi:Zn-dependent protease with chaperone function
MVGRLAGAGAKRSPRVAARWFSDEELARSAARHRTRAPLRATAGVLDAVVPLVVLASGAAAAVAWLAGPSAAEQAAAVGVAVELARIPHRFALEGWVEVGEARRSASGGVASFVVAFISSSVVRMVLTGAALAALVEVAAFSPWWPALVWAAMVAAMVLAGIVAPLLVVPARDGVVRPSGVELDTEIAALAARAGVRPPRLLVATNPAVAGGGYIAGLGRRGRLVLGAELALGDPRDRAAVVAHELGHVRLGHQGQALGAWLVLSAAEMGAVWAFVAVLVARVPSLGGVVSPLVGPLLLAAATVAAGSAHLALAALSRRHERAADQFAAQLLGSADDLIRHLRSHLVDSGCELEPRRLWQIAASHPPPADRLARLAGLATPRSEAVTSRA